MIKILLNLILFTLIGISLFRLISRKKSLPQSEQTPPVPSVSAPGSEDPIWAIRGSIQKLEDLKDQIIQLFETDSGLDRSSISMWVSDAKEVYYGMVAAWEMLTGSKTVDPKYAASCRTCLEMAQSRMLQTASELKSIGNVKAMDLEQKLRETFDVCYEAIKSQLPEDPVHKQAPPEKFADKISEAEYRLLCSLCGSPAARFGVGIPQYMGVTLKNQKSMLVYEGIAQSAALDLEEVPKIFDWLGKEDFRSVHDHVKQELTLEDGLDCYCPECDKIFCREHYQPREEWDEGFYDCTYAVCPDGHRRKIDD